MRKLLAVLGIGLLITSCSTSKSENQPPSKNMNYQEVNRYFVKNTFPDQPKTLVLSSQKAFDDVFGPAPVMGKNGIPTPIDFSKNFVIAIIEKTSSQNKTIEIESINSVDNHLEVKYFVKTGADQGYQTRVSKIIMLNKKNLQPTVFKSLTNNR